MTQPPTGDYEPKHSLERRANDVGMFRYGQPERDAAALSVAIKLAGQIERNRRDAAKRRG